jgi:glycosyltransferase
MKRILICSNSCIGLYKFRLELIKELLKKSEIIISTPFDDSEIISQLKILGCKLIETNIDGRGMNPIKDFFLLLKYFLIILKVKPSMILTYTIKPNLYANIISRLLGKKYIITITGLGEAIYHKSLLSKILLKLYRFVGKKAKCIFIQNEDILATLEKEKVLNNNYQLVRGSGVNLQKFHFKEYPEITKNITFICIARILKIKGIDEILNVFKKLKDENYNVELVILGNIGEKKYEEILPQYEKDNIIKYLGGVSDVKIYLQQSHCLVHAAHSEGMSNVMLEAAAMGLPLIASNIPGCKEIIENGKNGYTFNVENEKDLYEKIIDFINLPYIEKKNMGLYSRKKVENEFDREIVINKYLEQIF